MIVIDRAREYFMYFEVRDRWKEIHEKGKRKRKRGRERGRDR